MTRLGYVMATYFAAMGVAIAVLLPTPTKLIWNATASAPIGFYTVKPAGRLAVPALVAVMPPEPLAAFMAERGDVGHGGRDRDGRGAGARPDQPRTARMAGLPGRPRRRNLPHELAGPRQPRRPLLRPLPASSVIGRAVPLWTDEDGDGRYEWRAPTH